jgi:nucleotide-binding universal stress UspA family protein
MGRRLLVVSTTPVEDEDLLRRVREHTGDHEAEVHVVAPAAQLSPLQWLASDEDRAREEAAEVAREAKETVEPDAQEVEAEVGDSDPVQAIEDALREFPADEVIIVTRPGDEVSWLEGGAGEEAKRRFPVPVTHLVED